MPIMGLGSQRDVEPQAERGQEQRVGVGVEHQGVHDADPRGSSGEVQPQDEGEGLLVSDLVVARDRESTRLNSSHVAISYAVFCLKKKKNQRPAERRTVE